MHRYALGLLAGTMFGAVVLSSAPAKAIGEEAEIVLAIGALQKAIGSWFDNLTGQLTDLTNPNSLSTMLSNGFSQLSNYMKASVGAQQQIADANNVVQATAMKQLRDVQIRDEQTPSPEFCTTLDSNQSIVAASSQSRILLTAITDVTDPRGEAAPGSPSYYGTAQGVQANTNLHLQRYCSAADQQAGLCTAVSKYPNGDQRAFSLFGQDTFTADGGVDAANDYATTLIQPVAPAALRGDQINSTSGKEAWVQRRSYNGRMSLARTVTAYIEGIHTSSVTLTPDQQAELKAEGQPALTTGSWLQAISLEVNRRVSGVKWAAMIQQMPPATVVREIATELALQNYIALQNYRVAMFNASLGATQLATTTEQGFKGVTPMTSPTIASN